MMRPIAITLLLLGLGGCTEATSEANLSYDYLLETTDPEGANTNGILLRYEDDWLPGTCVGITERWDAPRVQIEWQCLYRTNAGPQVTRSAVEGVLFDEDGDGTYEGDLLMNVLPDLNSITRGPLRLVHYTMRPVVVSSGTPP